MAAAWTRSEVVGAAFLPADGIANPTDVTQALAAAARLRGGQIFEHTAVTDVLTRRRPGHRRPHRARATSPARSSSTAPGCGPASSGARSGVHDPAPRRRALLPRDRAGPGPAAGPARPALPGRHRLLPRGRRQAHGRVLRARRQAVGDARDPGRRRVRARCPRTGTTSRPYVEMAARRVPLLATSASSSSSTAPRASPRTIATSWARRRAWTATSSPPASTRSASSPGRGAGRAVADWIVDGHPPMDLSEVDIRRFMPFQANRRYLHDRTTETLGLLYDMHWPFRQVETARGVRRSAVPRSRWRQHGACFGETAGWERANWYATAGRGAALRVQLRPPELVRRRRRRSTGPCAEAVGIFDQTLVRQDPRPGARRGGRAQPHLRQRRRGRARPDRLHPVAQRSGRDRGRRHGHAPRRDERSWWSALRPTSSATSTGCRRHIPPDARCVATDVTVGLRGAERHGTALARAAGAGVTGRPLERGLPVRDVARDRPRLRARPRVRG